MFLSRNKKNNVYPSKPQFYSYLASSGKVLLYNNFQITDWTKLHFFLADTEYYSSLKYHTKEFVIRLWLSALAMTVNYATELAGSE